MKIITTDTTITIKDRDIDRDLVIKFDLEFEHDPNAFQDKPRIVLEITQ